ncbi:MAG: LuxR family transcriptional regulator [Kordiimonadaceae bacterium]|nr:LuxR family transcriptional regulator [Kordiimonadaceae bacterium]MBO6569578.1 LuxR family transcriptional regulator [Kordiimonadaceae bacterium]
MENEEPDISLADRPDSFMHAVFGQAVAVETNLDKLGQLCTDFFTEHGAVMSSYHHVPPVGATDHDRALAVAAQGFPDDWVKRYVEEELHKIDPIPKYALKRSEPFWWFDLDGNPDLSADEQRYMDILKAQDLGDGLAIPLFGPNGRTGYAGIGFGKNPPPISALKIMQLQNAAQLAHQRYCAILQDKRKEDMSLSARELEILSWVVRGKSNGVIADILGISSYTVDTYVRRIFGKLGVSNRVTAVLRATSIGLVD